MKYRLTLAACAVLLSGQMATLPPERSPQKSADAETTRTKPSADLLTIMKEPSLQELSKNSKVECYRFVWVRTFHHPVLVRLDVNADGSAMVTAKMTSGKGGYGVGHLTKNTTRKIRKCEIEWFLNEISEDGFWELPDELPSAENVVQLDGAGWTLEGTKSGAYHRVYRWSPESGPVRALGISMLIDVAKLKLLYQEVY